MHDDHFKKLIEDAFNQLPESIREKVRNVALILADDPTEEQRIENDIGEHDVLFGLYEGVPLPERGIDSVVYPDKITIFKKQILSVYSDEEDIRACVANTLWHELAHYFGFGEEWVEAEEKKRGKEI